MRGESAIDTCGLVNFAPFTKKRYSKVQHPREVVSSEWSSWPDRNDDFTRGNAPNRDKTTTP